MSALENILKENDREKAFFDLVKLYFESDERKRMIIREKFDFNCDWETPNQTKLACSKNARYSPLEKIKASLIYLSITSNKIADLREVIFALVVIYQSMKIVNINTDSVFEEIANVSDAKFNKILRDFISRKEEDKALKAFLLHKVENKDGEIEIKSSY